MKGNLFAGSGILTRFIFRRDRIRLLIWIIFLAGFVISLVPVFENLLTSGTDNSVMAEMMKNPAMISIVGPVYGADNYTIGAAYSNMMLVFSVMIAGVMNIFLISRHTRQDEELGRLEVIRSLPVGRLSNLAAAIIVSLIVNIILSIFSGIGLFILRENGMSFSGCMLFGAALGVIGLFFAASSAIFCQLTANNRTAIGFSFMLMLVLYMMRAVGDIGTEVLSLISPLGLILRTENFVNDYWWPVWVILGITVILIVISFALAKIRDLGRGLVPEKPGKRHGSTFLSSAYGLALRLNRSSIIVWMITIFILAAMYGSIFGELESFMTSNEMMKAIFSQDPNHPLTEQFIALLMTIMSLISAIPVIQCANRVSSEEKRGHAEHILSRSVSRYSQLAAYLIPALILSIILQILSALGFWSVGSMVLETTPSLKTFLISAMSYIPAIWIFTSLSMVLIAYIPNLVSLSYVYLGYTFIAVYLGTIAGFPEWTKKLTPFGYIPQYPIEEMKLMPLVIMIIISILLALIAFFRYGRRDTMTQ